MPRWQMILYASGSLSVALSYQAFATFIQFLYIDVFGLRAAAVGLIWSLYGIWNAVNDPLAGYWSDRKRTPWGRRIPWIAALFVPLSVSFYFLWSPPASLLAGPSRNLLVHFLAMVLIFDLLWTLVVMNWTALFPEMVPDERQRTAVSGWRQIFSILGLLVGVTLPPVLAGADWSGRGSVALLLSVVTALFFATSLLGSRERGFVSPQNALPFAAALRATLRNRDFRRFLGANLAIQFIFMMLTATTPFYTKYVLRIQGPLAIPALGVTLDAATLLLFFLPRDFYGGLAVVVLFGLGLAGLLMLTDLLIADVVDDDELKTGRRREGMFFGMNGFVVRFAFTVQGVITGAFLELGGYVAPSAGVLYPEQPAAARWGIRTLIGGIPALAALAAFLILRGYTLHGDRLRALQRAIAHLHIEGPVAEEQALESVPGVVRKT
ncbi:MAG TPA: MFS transporter [Candidatus Binatia bacterium]|nr:MFS transporter [Candidatus Binatia bacterium]